MIKKIKRRSFIGHQALADKLKSFGDETAQKAEMERLVKEDGWKVIKGDENWAAYADRDILQLYSTEHANENDEMDGGVPVIGDEITVDHCVQYVRELAKQPGQTVKLLAKTLNNGAYLAGRAEVSAKANGRKGSAALRDDYSNLLQAYAKKHEANPAKVTELVMLPMDRQLELLRQ